MLISGTALVVGAAKFVGSMVAWEVGTRALEYGMDKYNEEDSIEQPQAESKIGPEYDDYGNYIGEMGLLGASVGTAYGGKKMYNMRQNSKFTKGMNNNSARGNSSILSKSNGNVKVNPREFKGKGTPVFYKDGTIGYKKGPGVMLSKSRALTLVGGGGSGEKYSRYGKTGTIPNNRDFVMIGEGELTTPKRPARAQPKAAPLSHWEQRSHKSPQNISLFKAPVKVSPNTKGGKKVFKWASKYVKSNKLNIALMGLGLVGTIAGVLKSKPSNQMGDAMAKAMALNKGFQDTIEPELGIDYMSKIQHNLAKKLSSLLEESTISEEGIDSLMNAAEADIHDKFMETVTNSFQMFMKNGSPEAMNNSAKELQALKKGKRLIGEQADIIRGTGTVEDKNKARNKIVQLKDLVFSFGDQNKSLESAIKLGLDYQRNIVAMRSMLGRTGVTGTAGKTKIDTGKLQLLHQLLMEWDTYSEEEQTALESTKTYLENLVPSTEGGWGGLTLKDMAR